MELFTWMNIFNWPILQKQLFFYTVVLLFCGIMFFKCLQILRDYRRLTYSVAKLPQIISNSWLTYPCYLFYLYKHRKEIPAPAYVFQIICGMCEICSGIGFFNLWIFTRPFIFIFRAKTAEVILNSSSNIEKAQEYKLLESWLGKGLVTSKGDTWKSRRKFLTPAFHFQILEDFLPICNAQAIILNNKLMDLAKQDWVDVVHAISMCTLDIVCETAMGISINAQGDVENEYVKALHGIGMATLSRVLWSFLSLDFLFYLLPSGRRFRKNINTIHKFIQKVIKEKKSLYLKQLKEKSHENRKTFENDMTTDVILKKNKRKPFLDMLLELHFDDPLFMEKDIKDEVNTFMFAGYDTTATATSWALFNIGLHPSIQEKIINELDMVFDGDNERDVTLNDIKSMKFLDLVLKESMRIYPPVPFFGREITEDTVIDENIIPVGCGSIIIPWIIHRDPQVYPNPEVFDPDRFLPENCAGRHPYAYIPFSAGPRNCIGQRFALMEEKVLISQILRRFRIKSLDPPDKVVMIPDLVLRCVKPLRIKLIPRVMKQ